MPPLQPTEPVPLEYSRKGRKRPLPAQPTTALPGTPEKVAVLESRLARGEQLWHPLDAKLTLDVTRPCVPLSLKPRQRKPGAGVVWIPQRNRFRVLVARRIEGKVIQFYGGLYKDRKTAEAVANTLAQEIDGGTNP